MLLRWAANNPLVTLHQYVPELRALSALALDCGDQDQFAEPTRELSRLLSSYGIEHSLDIYPGDHSNRVHERLEQDVLPFFSRHLTAQ